MLGRLIDAWQRGRTLPQIEALTAQLIEENERLRLENAKLRQENRQLRRRLPDGEMRILRRAHADASLLTLAHLAGCMTSRNAAAYFGVSRRRWAWATTLLRKAGCMSRASGWVDYDAETHERMLGEAVGIVEMLGFDVLKLAAPRNGFSGQHRNRGTVTRLGAHTVTRQVQNVTAQRGKGSGG